MTYNTRIGIVYAPCLSALSTACTCALHAEAAHVPHTPLWLRYLNDNMMSGTLPDGMADMRSLNYLYACLIAMQLTVATSLMLSPVYSSSCNRYLPNNRLVGPLTPLVAAPTLKYLYAHTTSKPS